jgi:hypothetical protein
MSTKIQFWARREVEQNERANLADQLFKEFGVENHPKKDKCFELAWEHGHANRDSEVRLYFEDFVALIKD